MPRWFNSTCFTAELEQTSMAVLELSHCSLTTVPSDIFKSKEGKLLEEVYLDANQLRDLPRALFSLQNLQVLNLSDNELTIIPSAISNLVNLREVNFSKNGIIDLPENIKNCKNLQEIDASVNPIGKISEGVSQLINLTHLYLNDAFIDFLPASFGRLAKLKILELRDNHMRVLPKSMSHLTQLERLDIGSNEFVELPAVVGCLLNLKELWIDSNSIKEVKPEIGLLRQLVFFDASKNRLEWLPPEIESLQALTDLHLSNNLLIDLPEQIGCLGNLQTLKLDENHLGDLPNSIGRLHNLEELVLTCNELTEFPASIGHLRNLRVLYGDENFLESIPPELGSCTSMTILSLRDNKLEHIPEDIGRMPNLQVINLACNKLEYLPYTFHKLASLTALWLSENQSKPIVPLQSEYNKAKGMHVLTCYMFPQEPLPEQDNVSMNSVEIHDDQENGNLDSVTLETLPEPSLSPPQRTSIVFDIDEDDYVARLARFSSPYPKDVRDRAAQYLASRRQHQHLVPDNNNEPAASSRHHHHEQQAASSRHHQHELREHRHPPKPTTITEETRHHDPVPPRPPAPVSSHDLPPAPPFIDVQRHSQEISEQGVGGVRNSREIPWYDEQPRDSSESGSVVSLHSDHSASINPTRRTVGASSTRPTLNGESSTETRTEHENSPNSVFRANGKVPLYPPSAQNVQTSQSIPPPIYSGQQSSSSYASSLPSHYSFREEEPSTSSSMRNPPTGEWVQHNPREPQGSTVSYDDVHSFGSEEPSLLYGNNRNNQPVLRPPSYHEAIGHRNPTEELNNHIYVDQLRPSGQRTIDATSEIDPRFSPPPGYSTIDPRVWSREDYSQPPLSSYENLTTSGGQTSGYVTAGRQPVSLSCPETTRVPQTNPQYVTSTQDPEHLEERVRQLQIQRREGRRVIDSTSSDQDNQPMVTRMSTEEIRVPLASRDDEEEFTVRIHKNPNLGFSIAGGKESTTNPYDPLDPKCIYVTKVQPEGPAAYYLKPGDKLLEVNGINLRSISHEHAVTFLKNNHIVDLLISRKADEL